MGMHSSRKLQLEQATLMDSLFIRAFSMTLADSPSNQFLGFTDELDFRRYRMSSVA
jgi:hypothetical protein